VNVGSLFSGIGGLDLGLERAGMSVRWQCEIDPYCRAVLRHHWPDVPRYEDIRDIDGGAEPVDLICGGFPCQPVSLAGKGLAQEDPRWLWPEMARVVGLLRPRYLLVENVPGLIRRGLVDVISDLAEMGYDAEWELVSAAACGAPHLRERIFVVGHTDSPRLEGHGGSLQGSREESSPPPGVQSGEEVANPYCSTGDGSWPTGEKVFRSEAVERLGRRSCGDGSFWAVEPDVGRVAHGVPNRLAQLRALGNAVVPQVAEAVGRMILEAA